MDDAVNLIQYIQGFIPEKPKRKSKNDSIFDDTIMYSIMAPLIVDQRWPEIPDDLKFQAKAPKIAEALKCIQQEMVTVDRSVTDVTYTSIQSLPIKKLKDKIKEIEGEEIFAGLEVFFKDHTKIWISENLVEIEKPKLVRETERYLRKRIHGHTEEDEKWARR